MTNSSDFTTNIDVFVGSIIQEIRRRQHCSQADLAAKIGMQPAQLCNIEKGKNSPSLHTLDRIAQALGTDVASLTVKKPYISREDTPTEDKQFVVSENSSEYNLSGENSLNSFKRVSLCDGTAYATRVLQKIPPETLKMIDSKTSAYMQLEDECGVSKRAMIPLFLPIEQSPKGAEQLARTVRTHFGIGSAVVFDYIELLENHGLRIIFANLPRGTESLSFYDSMNQNLFIIVEDFLNPEKQLFRAAFELGNVYLYTAGGMRPVTDTETNRRFAKQFAAAFLMPEESVRATVTQLGIQPSQWSYELLLRVKTRFGVSAESFAHRLEEIGAIDKKLRESLKEHIRAEYEKNGFTEPGDRRRELSKNGRFNDLSILMKMRGNER